MTKFVFYSDYSGCGCFREAFMQSWKAFKASEADTTPSEESDTDAMAAVTWSRSCDYAPVCQRVLRAIATEVDGGHGCVFSDLNVRLHAGARAWLDAATPAKPNKKSTDDVKKARDGFINMERWLIENRAWAFSGLSRCLVHNKDCATHPVDKEMCPSPCMKRARLNPDGALAGERQSPRPLYVNCAGVTCVAWSSVGLRLNQADASERAHMIWMTERMLFAEHLKEDVFFGECVPGYPVREKLKALSATHLLVHIVTGPEYLGWPTKRLRCFFAGLNLRTVAWSGGDNYATTFANKYYRMTSLTGDSLLVAPDEVLWPHYAQVARRRQNHMELSSMKAMDRTELLSLLISPSQLKTFAEYQELEADLMSPGGAFLADLEQRPSTASSPGPDFPPQLTHGCVVSFRTNQGGPRLAMGLEHLCAQGFHIFASAGASRRPSHMAQVFGSLSDGQQKRLSGNGIHLAPPLSCWMMFVLSNISRVQAE